MAEDNKKKEQCTIQNVSCCEFNLEQPKHIKEHIRFMDWVEYEKNRVLSSFAIPKNKFDKQLQLTRI